MSDTTGSSAAGPRVRLAAEDVSVRHGHVVAVDGVSLALGAGEVMGLVGPNGSGKTSLLRAMAGLRAPDSGRCVLDGDDLGALRARDRARRVAYVGQDEHSELPFTAREVMTLGRSQHGSAWSGYDRSDHDEVERVVDLLGLRLLADRPLAHMSGGERQRVLVGRGLVQAAGQAEPLMLLDEPTNHLDPRFQQTVLHTVTAEVGTAVVVLHDLDLAAAFCDRVALVDVGRLVAVGAPRDVLRARTLADLYRTRARVMRLPDRVHVLLGR